MKDYCDRCGKRTADIHTCSPNPVISQQEKRIKRLESALRRIAMNTYGDLSPQAIASEALHELEWAK